jgi:hypothetical protein
VVMNSSALLVYIATSALPWHTLKPSGGPPKPHANPS